jgi:putative membrane protein
MNVFKLTVAAAVAAFLAFSHSGYAQDKAAKAKAKLSAADQQALTRLAQGDLAEIAAAKLAQQKAQQPLVKVYAGQLVTQHQQMLDGARQVARAKGIKAPTAPDAKHQAALKSLQKASGAEFDRAFLGQMVKDHEEMLALAQKTAKEAKDSSLKAHAQAGVEHIRGHLEQARQLHGDASAGASAKPAAKKK